MFGLDYDYSGNLSSHSGNTHVSSDANCSLESGNSFNIGGTHNHSNYQKFISNHISPFCKSLDL